MAESKFDFKKFTADSLQILTSPKEYFTKMEMEGGLSDPIIRIVFYTLITILLNFIWVIIRFGPIHEIFGELLKSQIGALASVWALITAIFGLMGGLLGSVIGLFITSFIVLLISAICGGNTNYESNVRVTASLGVLMPVHSVTSFIFGFSFYLLMVVALVISFFGIIILYHGIVTALGGKKRVAQIVSMIIATFPVLILVSTFMCTRAIKDFTKDPEKFFKQFPKIDQKSQKSIDKLKRMMEEAQKKQKYKQ